MSEHIVIEHPKLKDAEGNIARATVGAHSAEHHKERGWRVVGPAVLPGVPITTEEQEAQLVTEPAKPTKSKK